MGTLPRSALARQPPTARLASELAVTARAERGAAAPDAKGAPLFRTRLAPWHLALGIAFLLSAALVSLLIGPADLSPLSVLEELAGRLPFVSTHSGLGAASAAVIWQLRLPRIVLGGLVGAMLALAGASYQGAFHNALADPYLLGVASGAGLGATLAVIEIPHLAGGPSTPCRSSRSSGRSRRSRRLSRRAGRRARGAVRRPSCSRASR